MTRNYKSPLLQQQIQEPPVVCIACGCSEENACPGPCVWVAVNTESGYGLCSSCAVFPLEKLIQEGLFP